MIKQHLHESVFAIKCKDHPRYKAKMKPRVDCAYCWEMYKNAKCEVRMDCPWYSHTILKCCINLEPCRPADFCHNILDDANITGHPIPMLVQIT